MDASLYVHIPFCKRKCLYCDFCSFSEKDGQIAAYSAALERELLKARALYGRMRVGTVYFGGGTPSYVSSDMIVHLIAMAKALFWVDETAEITVEVNPGTVDRQKLIDYRDAGVNRLSIGAQAFDDRLLKLLGRIHTAAEIASAVELARSVGFDNISLDLIYALPTQTMREWVDTLDCALSLKPAHLSCYSLIVEPGTPLSAQFEAGVFAPIDETLVLQMQHAAERILLRRGYHRYEISNYTLPGRACKHNMVYWTRGNYLGVGCAAHSMMDDVRFANTASLDAYIAGTAQFSREMLTPESIREETIMLGTRTAEGIPVALVRGKEEVVSRLRALGLITTTRDRLTLTQKGWDVHNAVVLELL